MSLYEYEATIPTLWKATKGKRICVSDHIELALMCVSLEFIDKHPEYLPKDNAMQFISDDGGNTYNRCHCKYPCS